VVIADAQGTGTIVNDDGTPGSTPRPAITINEPIVHEGDAGTTTASFVVSLSSPPQPGSPITVRAVTQNGTATSQGGDYVPLPIQTLTFASTDPDPMNKTIEVTINGDTLREPVENLRLNLSKNSANSVLADNQGRAWILDEEGPFTATMSEAAAFEGDAGSSPMAFDVCLSNVPTAGEVVTMRYSTLAVSQNAGDYTAIAATTLTFDQSTGACQEVDVQIIGDTTVEPNETFRLRLTNPSTNVVIADAQGTGTIVNDDA
jgi:hypothetical protein